MWPSPPTPLFRDVEASAGAIFSRYTSEDIGDIQGSPSESGAKVRHPWGIRFTSVHYPTSRETGPEGSGPFCPRKRAGLAHGSGSSAGFPAEKQPPGQVASQLASKEEARKGGHGDCEPELAREFRLFAFSFF